MTTDIDLHGTTDAMVWAEEFVRICRENKIDPLDEGFMVGWFANAMAAQEAEDRTAMEPVVMTHRELCDFAYTVAGATSVPFMRDNPTYVMPSEEIAEGVDPLLREQGVEPSRIRGYYSKSAPDEGNTH